MTSSKYLLIAALSLAACSFKPPAEPGDSAAASATAETSPFATLVEQVSLQPTRQGGTEVRYAFTGKLKVRRVREDGSLGDVALARARYGAQLTVFELTPGEAPSKIGESPAFYVSVDENLFSGTTEIAYSRDPDGRSPLVLAYEIRPDASAIDPTTLRGTKALGSLRAVSAGTPENDSTVLDVLEHPPAPVEARTRTPQADRVFQTDGSRGKFEGVGKYNPNTSEAVVGFNAQVRVVDPLAAYARIVNHPFEVLVSETAEWPSQQTGTRAVSNSEGDVLVKGSVTYREMGRHPEIAVRRFLLLRSVVAPYAGVVRAVPIVIDPSQRGDLFYRDITREGAPVFSGEGQLPASLVLSRYNAYFLKRTFEVNEHLQLMTLRQWNFTLKPMINRPNPSGRGETQPLLPGTRFKMTLVVGDPHVDAVREPLRAFIAGYEAEVAVNADSLIVAPVMLPVEFTQQHRLDSRARVHITLSPLTDNPQETLPPVVLSAPFVANPNGNDNASGETIAQDELERGTLAVLPSTGLRAFATPWGTGYALKEEWPESPLQMLAKHWSGYSGLDTVAEKGPSGWTATDAWMKRSPQMFPLVEFAESDGSRIHQAAPAILKLFCAHSDASLGALDRAACKKDPASVFSLSHFTVVDEVLNHSPVVDNTNTTFQTLSLAYFNEHQRARRHVAADKHSLHAVMGAGGKAAYGTMGSEAAILTASMAKEQEWFDLVEDSSGDSERVRRASSEAITLNKEEVVLGLSLRVRHCALVRPQRFSLSVSETTPSPLRSLLICSAPKEEKRQESWFAVRDRWNTVHSAHSDPKDPRERGWVKMVRGAQAFAAFEKLILDKTREYHFEKVDPYFDAVDTLAAPGFYTRAQTSRLQRDGGIFPGVLATGQTGSLLWSSATIRRYVELYMQSADKITDTQVRAAGERFAWCFFETAAARWPHFEYTRRSTSAESYNAILKNDGTRERCLDYARHGKEES